MDFKDAQAIYLQIADLVCDYVIAGKWNAGERILSVREFAVQLEVNPNTVMRAYECLQNQNIIFNKRGVGFFIREDAAAIIRQVRRKEFMDTELPELFRRMQLLDIPVEQIASEYEKWQQALRS